MRHGRLSAFGALLFVLATPASVAMPAPAVIAATPFTLSGPGGRVQIDGPWQLRSDHSNTGIQKGWGRGGFVGSTVTVPNASNANPHRLSGPRAVPAYNGTIAWYGTTFTVPRPGRYAIDFQSVNYRATVWVDGKRIGRSHIGEFQPFAKLFRADRGGKHTLVVRADYRNIELQKAQGYHRTWFNFGGINREVTVRPVGRSDIAAPAVTTVLTSGGAASVTVTAQVHNYGATRTVALTGSLTHDAERVELPFAPVKIAAGATRSIRARVGISSPALWAPGSPNLYDLDLAVAGEATWSGPTGLRQLTWKGRRIYLNGRRLLLHGASLQEDVRGRGDALLPADMDKLVADLKEVGANITRNHHPLAPALLERLDAAGIMVWQEVGPNDSPGGWRTHTAPLRRQMKARVRVSLEQLQFHPSIIIWSLGNEVANAGHVGGQAQWISSMARELHRRDPGRMVGVDIWGTHVPSSDRGLLIYRDLDVVGLTNYDGWYNDNTARGAALRGILRQSVDDFANAFRDKVLVVSEFGAEANNHNAPGKPGSYTFQTRLLREHINVYRADSRLAGLLVWVLRDYALSPTFNGGSIKGQVPGIKLVPGISQKGLFNFQDGAKPSLAVVARLLSRIPSFP
ncbi:MAG: beta-galactosidase [Solirubrobacteraceae bacterium]|nr:beta-galactosidase [Solirubrobacteraceae bacterium]